MYSCIHYNNSIFPTQPIRATMFSMQNIHRQMAVCSAFASQLLGQLRGTISNLPATSGMTGSFHIPLCNGYSLSVAIPSDKNRNLAPTDGTDCITVSTVLFKGDEIVYDDELGYADVRCYDFDAQAIQAEYERLMALLAGRD